MTTFDNPIFHDDEAARLHLESLLWPNGAVCPHCGCVDHSTRLQGKKHRPGVWKCNACKQQFTVTVGTVFEHSKVSLHTWMLAVHLLCASKKGMSAHQLHRMLGVTYKTAWRMAHRIRSAMARGSFSNEPMGGTGAVVEIDETYWGTVPGMKKAKAAYHHKEKIVSLVERNGDARSFHVQRVTASTLWPVIFGNVDNDTRLMTDEAMVYKGLDRHFAGHGTVSHHIREYARGDVNTNTVEGFFSILKRGLVGTYHHVGSNHLNRYLGEFDFRYNTRKATDSQRADMALKAIRGQRITYH